MKDFIELKSKQQIKIGDTLVIIGKSHSDSQVCEAEDIVSCDGENEEVIIDKENNKYFIVDVYLEGKSWAEDVFIVVNKQ